MLGSVSSKLLPHLLALLDPSLVVRHVPWFENMHVCAEGEMERRGLQAPLYYESRGALRTTAARDASTHGCCGRTYDHDSLY